MKFSIYDHCSGVDAIPESIKGEIVNSLCAVTIRPTRHSATRIRDAILQNLRAAGWCGAIVVSPESEMTITSLKKDIGLCVQTGNMARMYADLLKLQTLFLDDSIEAAAIILPSKPLASVLGSNIAQADRLCRELKIFRKAYHVPTMILAME